MLFPGKYWAIYWKLIKVSAGLAALGCLAWGALASLEMYEGYAELVLALIIFAPVGVVFLLNGLGIIYAVVLRLVDRTGNSGNGGSCAGTVGSVAVIGFVFLGSGLFFGSLAVNAVLAILAR